MARAAAARARAAWEQREGKGESERKSRKRKQKNVVPLPKIWPHQRSRRPDSWNYQGEGGGERTLLLFMYSYPLLTCPRRTSPHLTLPEHIPMERNGRALIPKVPLACRAVHVVPLYQGSRGGEGGFRKRRAPGKLGVRLLIKEEWLPIFQGPRPKGE